MGAVGVVASGDGVCGDDAGLEARGPEVGEVVRMVEEIVSRTEGEEGVRGSSDEPSSNKSGTTPPAGSTP
ncbi:uncharacterized protein A4U43_C08F6680 [Asparagus officinalis]|nr:uncharacterized protein A4U43_C08F6680 [Asparagus officinalis]